MLERLVVRIGVELEEGAKAKVDADVGKIGAKAVAIGNLVSAAIQKAASLAIDTLRGLIGFVHESVLGFAELGGEIADTSSKLGVGTDQLQRLRYAAKLSGVEASILTGSIRELQKGYTEARLKGTGPFAEGLGQLGLKLKELEGLTPEEQIKKIADVMRELPTEAERTAVALKLFGGAGSELMPLLRQGGAGIEELTKRAEELGIVLDKEAIARAEELGDTLDDLDLTVTSAKNSIAAEFAPAISSAVREVTAFVVANREVIATRLREWIEVAVPKIIEFAKWIAETAVALNNWAERSGGWETALKLVAGGFGAIKLAALGLPGIAAAVGVAIGAMAASVISDLNGVTQSIQTTTRMLHELANQGKGITNYKEAIAKVEKGDEIGKMTSVEFDRFISQGRAAATEARTGTGAQSISDRRAAEAEADRFERIARRQRGRAQSQQRSIEQGAAAVAATNAFLPRSSRQKARDAYAASLNKPKGGGGKAAPVKQMGFLEHFGIGGQQGGGLLGGIADALGIGGGPSSPSGGGGGGSSPLSGATFNRIDASFTQTLQFNLALPEGLANAGGVAIASDIARKTSAEISAGMRGVFEHYTMVLRSV